MDNINVTIDTNVLLGALKSNKGASYKLLMLLTERVFTANISVPLFIEYESVAKRTELVANLSEEDINDILNYFLSKSNIQKIFYLWRPFLKDPKDDLVLEVAVKSQSKYIITFNKKDFVGCEKFGIEVMTPYEFLTTRGLLS
ncbi:putative toxin-antitoxin system toxin component, PIN family [Leucothrix pacifica]|uniref:Putative toxin-antitoxin system toxin component, PIN family n=1 Tax=Leucothrix pacifica TaxID=1247513 RepID=A0A317CWS7_9GAMM|nr:putative toxin-antitoxin system toxin component, PIN family [Leucothrix pacifica]